MRSRQLLVGEAGSTPRTLTSPALRVAVALEDLDRGRLPGAVRPEEGEDLARGDLEVDSLHSLEVAVGLAQAPDADHGVGHARDARTSRYARSRLGGRSNPARRRGGRRAA